jgi:methylmalonyl-CoA mutase N-terminal domain/subunit
VPKWNTISICGYHVREAGCSAALEIAFTLGNGIA